MTNRTARDRTASATGPAVVVAFLSPARGVGRPATIANLAAILAGAGQRVLVVDWSLDTLRADSFFSPFFVETSRPDEPLAAVLDPVRDGPPSETRTPGWEIRNHRLPESLGIIDVLTQVGIPAHTRGWQTGGYRESDLRAARSAFLSSGYDHVLIDISAEATETLAFLPDIAVVVSLNRRLLANDVAAVASAVGGHGRAPRFYALVVDRTAAGGTTARSRELLAEAFGSAENVLRIDALEHSAADEILEVMAEAPGQGGALHAGYLRLASLITAGAVTDPPPVSDRVRANYRGAMALEPGAERQRIVVVHAPEDRRWADWTAYQLMSAGVDTRLVGPAEVNAVSAASASVLILTASLPRPPDDLAVLQPFLLRTDTDGAHTGDLREIVLAGLTEAAARATLLTTLGLVSPGPAADDAEGFVPRYPALLSRPPVSNLVSATDVLAGRLEAVNGIRDGLVDGQGQLVLAGPAGIGKTALAREYVRLFGADYGAIWQVPGQSTERIRSGLQRLAKALGLRQDGDFVSDLVDHLQAARPTQWLLVFDDTDPTAMADLPIPNLSSVHVIVTTRFSGAWTGLPVQHVPDLPDVDAADLLRSRLPGMTLLDARILGRALRGHPLSLALASSWLREMADYLQRAQPISRAEAAQLAFVEFLTRNGTPASATEAPGPITPRDCLRESFTVLETFGRGRSVRRLIEQCAHLASDGIAHWLLGSLSLRPDGARAEDSMGLHAAVHLAERYGLAWMDWKRDPTLYVSRAVQELVLSLQEEDRADARRRQVHTALAGLVPPEAGSGVERNARIFDELGRHLLASGAALSTDRAVCRWLAEQIRYLYVSGDRATWVFALDLAEGLREAWTGRLRPNDPLLVRLLTQIANLYRAVGDYQAALEAGDEALGRARRGGIRSLIALRGRSADYLALGRFNDALAENETAYESFGDLLGEEHPETVAALHNLAGTAFLAGRHREAVGHSLRALQRRRTQFGDGDWRSLWMEAESLYYQSELGATDDAYRALTVVRQRTRALEPRRPVAELRVQRIMSIVRRRMRISTFDEHVEIHQEFAARLGPDHPHTLAVRLGAATGIAPRHPARSVQIARECLSAFVNVYAADHPFTFLCRTDLAMFIADAGGDLDEALALAAEAHTGLQERLSDVHPWSLAAAVDRTRLLVAHGEVERAYEMDRETAADCREALGDEHPYTAVALAAEADSRTRLGGDLPEGPRPAIYLDVPAV